MIKVCADTTRQLFRTDEYELPNGNLKFKAVNFVLFDINCFFNPVTADTRTKYTY